MYLVNISAAEARETSEAEVLGPDAAVRAVCDEMAEEGTFAAACRGRRLPPEKVGR